MASNVSVTTRKLIRNPLLGRRQFVVDVSHPGLAMQKKEDIAALLSKLYNVDQKLVVLFGFKAAFGGGRSSGFGLIYDSEEDLKKFEPRHRLIKVGLATKKTRSRKQWKDQKRRTRVIFGTGRRDQVRAAKKAAAS